MPVTRRHFVRTTAALATAASLPTSSPAAAPTTVPSTQRTKPTLAVIGCGGMSRYHGQYLSKYTDVLAVADVDKSHADSYNRELLAGKAAVTTDYRTLLSRPDIDLVLIGAPDHWHVKLLVDSLRAGKDVYCEKPLTLTIDEGRTACRVARETSRVVQIGTQRRSETGFLTAVALAHAGRLGKLHTVTVAVGTTPAKGSNFPASSPPPELDWDAWLGPAPTTPYIKERCHFNFRWWYEYSGGMLTDWGAHHLDIAQLAAAPDLPGPAWVEPLSVALPVPFEHAEPTIHNAYNTATKFHVQCSFANGVTIHLRDRVPEWKQENGILLQGDSGQLFVNRSELTGPAVDELKTNPLPKSAIRPVGAASLAHERHFANFIDCVKSRALPASDIFSHVRHLNTCHLANIALRTNRKLRWDATLQQILNDPEANALQSRTPRKGYEIT